MNVILNAPMILHHMTIPLKDWCHDQHYIYPPPEFWTALQIILVDELPSQEVNRITHGSYSPGKLIQLRADLANKDATVIHELAHAIQHYNLGEAFWTVYKTQTTIRGYDDNLFEHQAREASAILAFAVKVGEIEPLLNKVTLAAITKPDPPKQKPNPVQGWSSAYWQSYYEKEEELRRIKKIWRYTQERHTHKANNSYKGRRC